ncbi:MAG: beta-CASP ribonuclease aCPSF1 [Archaeoglobi archaeon]|nr:beta-CASP ribonuclease aCPSF1 [Candidatus Mnemosynella bozhongmuii]
MAVPQNPVKEELKKRIVERLPEGVRITDLEFEGPELVIYTDEPRKIADDANLIRSLAKELRKRIVVRPDPKVLVPPEKAIEIIKEILPENSGELDFHFDPETGEILIEAEKPGVVIGKHGMNLREITKKIGWTPKVVRKPPIESTTIKNIRAFFLAERDSRKEILKKIGQRIHREISSKDNWVRVTALGGFREVGRSSALLSTPNTKIMIDCGVNTGSEENGIPYLYIPEVNPISEIDAVVVTHAHLDHCGLIPLLYKYGYDGPIYCTPPTRDLMVLLQLDYIDVTNKEGRRVPYDSSLIREALKHVITLNYGEVTDIAPDVRLTFHNAGHILGSAVAHFHIGEGLYNVAFTGDFKFEKTRLFEPAVNEFPRLEALVMEATYGGNEDFQPSRREAEAQLHRIIRETIDNKGKVLIPAFAVGRSQEVMIVLEEAMRNGVIEEVPIYLDGMIWEATAIHTAYPEYLNSELRNLIFNQGVNPFLSENFKQVDSSSKRAEILDSSEPCIVLSTSGMLNGGPVMEYLKAFAPDERNTLVFVGYQAEGTLGRRLQKGWKEIPMSHEGRTITVKVNMRIETVDGFSGHSDRRQLIEYVRRMRDKPEKILTVHGDGTKCIELASALYKKFKIETRAPMNLETVRFI